MSSKIWTRIIALTLFAALGLSLQLAAQDKQDKHNHHHYQFIDLGTFGGPASYFSNGFDGILNSRGTAAGWADTPAPDPFPAFPFNQDSFVSHAFQWQNGVLIDLGALPGGASSQALWITANGLIAGNSQNGEGDPLFPGWGEFRAVLWKDGKIIDLGTLEGGYESFVGTVNSRGQVVGLAMNTVPDPFNINGPGFFPTQSRAFLWQHGAMQDLGTLGGDDANAILINERGQIAGNSYTNSTPNPTTGIPTIDPFLWENGKMTDLGTLGGTIGNPSSFNNRGQVVGASNLAGDAISHPFLWTKAGGMQDLGTLGGDTGVTNWINDNGDIAGKADLLQQQSPEDHHAVLWRHGVAIDLGTFPEDTSSNAYNVNSRGQVVGTSEDRAHMLIGVGERAFLWEGGGPIVDLNTLIPSGSSLQLTYAVAINDAGEIVGFGVAPGVPPEDYETQGHAYILIPCDENHPGVEGCDYSPVDPAAATPNSLAPIMQRPTPTTPRSHPPFGRPGSSRRHVGTQTGTLPIAENGSTVQADGVANDPVPDDVDLHLGTDTRTAPLLQDTLGTLSGTRVTGRCVTRGGQCPPWTKCCPGLKCVPASTRAFCEP